MACICFHSFYISLKKNLPQKQFRVLQACTKKRNDRRKIQKIELRVYTYVNTREYFLSLLQKMELSEQQALRMTLLLWPFCDLRLI